MPIDPQVQVVLEKMKQLGVPPLHALAVEDARKINLSAMAEQPEEVWRIDNRIIAGPIGSIPVRIYTPRSEALLPVIVYYHGGGWMVGNLDAADVLCRRLANGVNSIVVSVDYRLAPEHKFPAATEDCYAALVWVSEHAAALGADADRIAVGGDSSGGNLAAVVSLMARDKGFPSVKFQLLFNPVTHYSFDTDSYIENAEGYGLTTNTMRWFWNHYLVKETDGQNPYASPLLAPDLSGLPPALVITAEFDPLRDDGEAYAEKLKAAGVPVEAKRYAGMVHGFMLQTGAYDQGRKAEEQAINALRKALHN
ncbi:acetyl esterase [Paenibacillus cellulosilyticus]|uniref:Acetyl esterase n=1 Tax=Paenibacillus cellulosilyticus TaxID=375489 RepID=A0A2V2YTG7_9BACL|nr:alpha/beta hydrolase [Paenibacillus cellulosilyticus]PWW02411.1 acetyl esterase [Paenibacillus cellulosilyticus]QKS47123.1 alpha/beta hydrolase [Paenibacillus cellulosilyticus]